MIDIDKYRWYVCKEKATWHADVKHYSCKKTDPEEALHPLNEDPFVFIEKYIPEKFDSILIPLRLKTKIVVTMSK